MKHLFVNYELALLAKEKGFNDECLACYRKILGRDEIDFILVPHQRGLIGVPEHFYTNTPLYQQLVDWFRKKEIFIHVTDEWDSMGGYNRGFTPYVNNTPHYYDGDCFIEYYNALSIALTEAFKLI